jgi:hypothetical protein
VVRLAMGVILPRQPEREPPTSVAGRAGTAANRALTGSDASSTNLQHRTEPNKSRGA